MPAIKKKCRRINFSYRSFMLTADKIISLLNLKPHQMEGGYFAETYRSGEILSRENLPGRYSGPRVLSTAIYYLLTSETFSEMHMLKSDEIFHFYIGDPVEMLRLNPDGSGGRIVMGSNILSGHRLQETVPAGVWQGTRLIEGGRFALLGTTVSPGFDYSDYETGVRDELIRMYPAFNKMIMKLTRV
jgi:predicted cupin superfamily sugar epimerase